MLRKKPNQCYTLKNGWDKLGEWYYYEQKWNHNSNPKSKEVVNVIDNWSWVVQWDKKYSGTSCTYEVYKNVEKTGKIG